MKKFGKKLQGTVPLSVPSHDDFWVMPYVWEQGMNILVSKMIENVGNRFYVEMKSFVFENYYKLSESRALEEI